MLNIGTASTPDIASWIQSRHGTVTNSMYSLLLNPLGGKIGIGSTAPASLLEMQGGLTTVGSVLTLGTKEPTVVVNDVLGRLDFYAPLEASGSDAILVGASIVALAEDTFTATVNKTSLLFQTGASETATTKMTITSAGNVGIGTTAPTTKLDVNGSAIVRSDFNLLGNLYVDNNLGLTYNNRIVKDVNGDGTFYCDMNFIKGILVASNC
jgi:hypothetical protein